MKRLFASVHFFLLGYPFLYILNDVHFTRHSLDEAINRLITNFIVQLWHIELRFLPIKQMILGLLNDWRHAIKLTTIRVGFHDFHGCPSRRTPVHYPTFAYNVIHSANDL